MIPSTGSKIGSVWVILTLGMAYGATISFTFFGPVLFKTAGTFAPALSLVAVAFHVLSFYLSRFGFESKPEYFRSLALVLVPGILLFHWAPVYVQALVTMVFAWTIGRVGCFWTYLAMALVPEGRRGRTVASSLLIAFGVLYLINVSQPWLTPGQALVIPAVMTLSALFCYNRMAGQPAKTALGRAGGREPLYFSFLLLVYITGGFTYAGIYPCFAPWAAVDRYYNVLALVASLPLAGRLADARGIRVTFGVGILLLGLALFCFLALPSLTGYLSTQTFLQAGWAFVNVTGWVFSWHMALVLGHPYHFPRGVSAMLLGAALGAFLANLMATWGGVDQAVYGLAALLPLGVALGWLGLFPHTLLIRPERPQD